MPATLHALRTDRVRRLIAAGGAVLVLALAVFAASPAAHAWLHSLAHTGQYPVSSLPAGDNHDDDSGCAIVLFSGGLSLPVGPESLLAPLLIAHSASFTPARELDLPSPRYLRQPERGPPHLG